MSPPNPIKIVQQIASHYTLMLFCTSSLLTLSSANFAFDNQAFAQTQAMNPFIRQFGNCAINPKTHKETCRIPTYFTSLFNSEFHASARP